MYRDLAEEGAVKVVEVLDVMKEDKEMLTECKTSMKKIRKEYVVPLSLLTNYSFGLDPLLLKYGKKARSECRKRRIKWMRVGSRFGSA